MGTLAILLLAFPLGVLVMMLLATLAMNLAAPRMIGDKHHALQAIVETRQVPESWRAPFLTKAATAPAERLAALQQQAKARYLQQLDGLLAYSAKSRLVSDEETRQMLLDQLAEVRAEWQARAADEL